MWIFYFGKASLVSQKIKKGSIPGPERSPGERNDYPLQYSCLENPIMKSPWWQGEWHNSSTTSLSHPIPGHCCSRSICWMEGWHSSAVRKGWTQLLMRLGRWHSLLGTPLAWEWKRRPVLKSQLCHNLLSDFDFFFSSATKLCFSNFRHLCAKRIFAILLYPYFLINLILLFLKTLFFTSLPLNNNSLTWWD